MHTTQYKFPRAEKNKIALSDKKGLKKNDELQITLRDGSRTNRKSSQK